MSLLLVGQAQGLLAQPVTNSPYARFGIGNQVAGANVRSTGLGNMGVAIREDSIPFVVNFINPASYTSLGFTSFDVGAYASVGTLRSATQQENVNRFNLSYLTLGFPITKWWGGAFGIREYSSTKYSVTDIKQYANSDTSSGDIRYKFEGEGGLNQAFIGIGLKPFKNLSLGINVSYMFGKLNHLQRVEFPASGLLHVRTDNVTDVSGIYLDYGLQYTARINGRHALVAGGTFAHPMKVGASSSRMARTYMLTTVGTDAFRDTVMLEESSGGSITMPWKYGLGLTWKIGGRWMFGAEFNQQLWSQYVNAKGTSDSLSDSWGLRAGAEFKPGGELLGRGFFNYFKRIQYRLGGFYGMSEYTIRGQQLSEYGMTIGFGLPMARRKAGNDLFIQSMVNLSVEWGQRGTITNNLLLEDYWVFRLGFTLNDRWFIKRKYD
ncbi:MAG: hypothetical protein K9J06_10430 [Flavobacteriales bacterium]|nr:hypothetical protein [Flavobacteriales bacterium]